jgi:uncharacterized membrane protein
LLLAIVYVLIFTRRGEAQRMKTSAKRYDWITNLAIIFGAVALMSGLFGLGVEIPEWLPITLLAVFAATLIGVIIFRIKKGKTIVRNVDDERTEKIYAKSSRNALLVTFLGLLITLSKETSTVDAKWLVVTLGAGLLTLLVSAFVYYYQRS